MIAKGNAKERLRVKECKDHKEQRKGNGTRRQCALRRAIRAAARLLDYLRLPRLTSILPAFSGAYNPLLKRPLTVRSLPLVLKRLDILFLAAECRGRRLGGRDHGQPLAT